MKSLEMARRLAEIGKTEGACKAYTLAIHESAGNYPEVELEAAAYILQMGGDYKIAYTCFQSLYDRGCFREDCLAIMTGAFYEPNVKQLKSRYNKNCKLLKRYPYLFRKDFLDFEELPIRFYPFDDSSYTPYYVAEERFGAYLKPNHPVISRNFFKDLEKPILAADVYSQYELEYLYDNVRKSELVARENHVYLHYKDWGEFCSHLTVLKMRPLLEDKKIVFLIGDEIEQYPIDFKARFGIDYSKYELQPVGIREIHRLIWHTQFSTHNGGDFFSEIFDAHPNMLTMPSLMFDNIESGVKEFREKIDNIKNVKDAQELFKNWTSLAVVKELFRLPYRTDKDILVAMFLGERNFVSQLDKEARISPAMFFQPHFANIDYSLKIDDHDRAVLYSKQQEAIEKSPIFHGFKYIKTFTPLRRFTTSHAASVKFMYQMYLKGLEEEQKQKEEEAAAKGEGAAKATAKASGAATATGTAGAATATGTASTVSASEATSAAAGTVAASTVSASSTTSAATVTSAAAGTVAASTVSASSTTSAATVTSAAAGTVAASTVSASSTTSAATATGTASGAGSGTKKGEKVKKSVVADSVTMRMLNRSFMIDRQNRLFTDSVLVRFEDAKLNPKATFTAMAAFLDVPYTETMTYCSLKGKRDPESLPGNDIGFSTEAVYRTYDDWVNDTERYWMEYFLRDVYEHYGYSFHYYDGAPMDEERCKEMIKGFTTINKYMRETWRNVYSEVKNKVKHPDGKTVDGKTVDQLIEEMTNRQMAEYDVNRLKNAQILLKGLRFINHSGQPLYMMPMLQLDPELLENPIYH